MGFYAFCLSSYCWWYNLENNITISKVNTDTATSINNGVVYPFVATCTIPATDGNNELIIEPVETTE